jgi:SulP family sulfate permease
MIRLKLSLILGKAVVGISTIEALNKLTERYKNAGKKIHLRYLSNDCKVLLRNANDIIDVNVLEDQHYTVVVDKI